MINSSVKSLRKACLVLALISTAPHALVAMTTEEPARPAPATTYTRPGGTYTAPATRPVDAHKACRAAIENCARLPFEACPPAKVKALLLGTTPPAVKLPALIASNPTAVEELNDACRKCTLTSAEACKGIAGTAL